MPNRNAGRARAGRHLRRMVYTSTGREPLGRDRARAPVLQDDEGVTTRITAAREGSQAGTCTDREPPPQLRHARDHGAVVTRVRHEQDDPRDAEVALLPGNAAFECLDVIEMRFGFDDGLELRAIHERVGTATVALDRHRHFRPPAKTCSES